MVYHVLNRTVGKMKMFRREGDFEAFGRVMAEAHERHPIRVLSYCLMPTHWHFVVWPEADGQVTAFFRWLTHTHAMRWRTSHHTVGYGHLYQGRFKSFPVQTDEHLLMLLRYVEANALKAKLVERAEDWKWGSLWRRLRGSKEERAMLSEWPVPRPREWVKIVNRAAPDAESQRVRQSLERSRPLGDDRWTAATAARLGLDWTLRPRGRPPKQEPERRK